MTLQELSKKTDAELEELAGAFAGFGNLRALGAISIVREWRGRDVEVVKGRKVPIGTRGTVFWLGAFDNSKYGDPWGIYTTYRAGIRTDTGDVYWTSLDNLQHLNG